MRGRANVIHGQVVARVSSESAGVRVVPVVSVEEYGVLLERLRVLEDLVAPVVKKFEEDAKVKVR